MTFVEGLEWGAALLVPAGLLFQIVRIYQHKEVRDLSLVTYSLFTLAYITLSFKAADIGSDIFLVKNVLSLMLSIVLVGQRVYYKNSKWIDTPKSEEKHEDKALIEDLLILMGDRRYTENEYTSMVRGIVKNYSRDGTISLHQRNALITHYNNNSLNYRRVL